MRREEDSSGGTTSNCYKKNTSQWYWEGKKKVFRRDFQHKKRKEERVSDLRRHTGGIFLLEESVPRYVCCRLLHPHYFLVCFSLCQISNFIWMLECRMTETMCLFALVLDRLCKLLLWISIFRVLQFWFEIKRLCFFLFIVLYMRVAIIFVCLNMLILLSSFQASPLNEHEMWHYRVLVLLVLSWLISI